MFEIGCAVAYKPLFSPRLLVNGSMLSMPAKYALHATCSWELHRGRQRKFSKARVGRRGRDHENQNFLPRKQKNVQKTSTTITTSLRTTLIQGCDLFIFSDVCLSVQIVYIFDTAEIKLWKFHQPSHSSSVRLIFISPICYLKSSLAKRPLLNQESCLGGNCKNVQ